MLLLISHAIRDSSKSGVYLNNKRLFIQKRKCVRVREREREFENKAPNRGNFRLE